MNKKVILFILLAFLISISCRTQKVEETVIEEIKLSGFRYNVPPYLEESPNDAYSFRYDNLIKEKGIQYDRSNVIIAIRHAVNYDSYSLSRFVELDQAHLNTQMNINYDKVRWTPPGFQEKDIDHVSYQFYYKYREELIFQRSVYLECDDKFYVVSLSSKNKLDLLDGSHDLFWSSIRID